MGVQLSKLTLVAWASSGVLVDFWPKGNNCRWAGPNDLAPEYVDSWVWGISSGPIDSIIPYFGQSISSCATISISYDVRFSKIVWRMWRFRTMGVPHTIIHLNRLSPTINQPFWGTPMTMETSIYPRMKRVSNMDQRRWATKPWKLQCCVSPQRWTWQPGITAMGGFKHEMWDVGWGDQRQKLVSKMMGKKYMDEIGRMMIDTDIADTLSDFGGYTTQKIIREA